jgi:MurNAc alpha-1-phosphate uridylyltransferase
MRERPTTAMVLAAGLGTRMRPLTEQVPKPLVRLSGRALIDHVLDRIAEAGIEKAVVNVHYRADQIERHVAGRLRPKIVVSDERDALLDTGGGVARALPLLGRQPFLVHNSDTVWIERGPPNIARLMDRFDPAQMATLLLLAPREESLGYDGDGDFNLEADGRLSRRKPGERAHYVFAGVSIVQPDLFAGAPAPAFSLNAVWNRALAEGRLYGMSLDGIWMHVGDPAAVIAAEARIAAHG